MLRREAQYAAPVIELPQFAVLSEFPRKTIQAERNDQFLPGTVTARRPI
jgi:hypothetical protein